MPEQRDFVSKVKGVTTFPFGGSVLRSIQMIFEISPKDTDVNFRLPEKADKPCNYPGSAFDIGIIEV